MYQSSQDFRTSTMELTSIAGLAGLPQLVLPVGSTCDEGGLPLSLSLVGGPGSEHFLMSVAEQLGREGKKETGRVKKGEKRER